MKCMFKVSSYTETFLFINHRMWLQVNIVFMAKVIMCSIKCLYMWLKATTCCLPLCLTTTVLSFTVNWNVWHRIIFSRGITAFIVGLITSIPFYGSAWKLNKFYNDFFVCKQIFTTNFTVTGSKPRRQDDEIIPIPHYCRIASPPACEFSNW